MILTKSSQSSSRIGARFSAISFALECFSNCQQITQGHSESTRKEKFAAAADSQQSWFARNAREKNDCRVARGALSCVLSSARQVLPQIASTHLFHDKRDDSFVSLAEVFGNLLRNPGLHFFLNCWRLLEHHPVHRHCIEVLFLFRHTSNPVVVDSRQANCKEQALEGVIWCTQLAITTTAGAANNSWHQIADKSVES